MTRDRSFPTKIIALPKNQFGCVFPKISIQGLFLLLKYTDDVPSCCTNSGISLFADDTTTYNLNEKIDSDHLMKKDLSNSSEEMVWSEQA